MFGPIGSVAISGLPMRLTMVSVSGNSRTICSSDVVIRTASESATLGRRFTLIAMAPSSNLGRNSAPRYGNNAPHATRSEEHTSELQSRLHLVCRLLLEKKKQ